MNTAAQVTQMMNSWKQEGIVQTLFVKRLANACIGYPYVFGGLGEYCTPKNRQKYYSSKKKETIKTKCKNFNGDKGCSGCKWYPGGVTRFFDCRGFTRWLFEQIGIKIKGGGATSQYNDDSNWAEKGQIANMPKDKICCVFRYDSGTRKMEHTLFYDGEGHYIHDSGEVKRVAISKYKATHYAIPKGLYGTQGTDAVQNQNGSNTTTSSSSSSTSSVPVYPTIRRGAKGELVVQLQRLLSQDGSSLAIDGIFGPGTESAVRSFQRRHGLVVDGIVGPKTWTALLNLK